MKDHNDYRVTIYCNSEEQKIKIQSKIKNVQYELKLKKMGDAAEIICEGYDDNTI